MKGRDHRRHDYRYKINSKRGRKCYSDSLKHTRPDSDRATQNSLAKKERKEAQKPVACEKEGTCFYQREETCTRKEIKYIIVGGADKWGDKRGHYKGTTEVPMGYHVETKRGGSTL